MSDITAIDVLRNYQKQCDADGIEVQVSRQALDEVLDHIEELERENAELKTHWERVRADLAAMIQRSQRAVVAEASLGGDDRKGWVKVPDGSGRVATGTLSDNLARYYTGPPPPEEQE